MRVLHELKTGLVNWLQWSVLKAGVPRTLSLKIMK